MINLQWRMYYLRRNITVQEDNLLRVMIEQDRWTDIGWVGFGWSCDTNYVCCVASYAFVFWLACIRLLLTYLYVQAEMHLRIKKIRETLCSHLQ